MPRRIPSKVAAVSAVAATALILDPPMSSCAYAFTPTSSAASSLRTSGPLHLSNRHVPDSFVPRNSLLSSDRRSVASSSSSMRIPSTSTSKKLDRMELHAANKGGEIEPDYANMKPQVYPQRWVQLAYLSLLALLVSFVQNSAKRCARNLFSCANFFKNADMFHA